MNKKFNDIVKELNEYFKNELENTNKSIVIHPFNKAIRARYEWHLYKSTKDFKNTVFRLYHGLILKDKTHEEIYKLFPSRGDKGKVDK